MTRKLTLLTILITICLMSCGQNNTETKNKETQKNIYTVDTLVIAILPSDTTRDKIFKNSKPTDLASDDLIKIETILNKCINDYNPKQENRFNKVNEKHPEYKLDKKHFTLDLKDYKRQYVAVINSKGEKEVWVNCFCKTYKPNWKEETVVVKDGGNCYFNVKINLTTGQYYELIVNGNA